GASVRLAQYGNLPLSFEINQGQTDPQIKFLARDRGYGLFLTARQAILSLTRATREGTCSPDLATRACREKRRTAVLRMRLLGTNLGTQIAGEAQLPL